MHPCPQTRSALPADRRPVQEQGEIYPSWAAECNGQRRARNRDAPRRGALVCSIPIPKAIGRRCRSMKLRLTAGPPVAIRLPSSHARYRERQTMSDEAGRNPLPRRGGDRRARPEPARESAVQPGARQGARRRGAGGRGSAGGAERDRRAERRRPRAAQPPGPGALGPGRGARGRARPSSPGSERRRPAERPEARPNPQLDVESLSKRGDGAVGEPEQRGVERIVVERAPVEAPDDKPAAAADTELPAEGEDGRRLQVDDDVRRVRIAGRRRAPAPITSTLRTVVPPESGRRGEGRGQCRVGSGACARRLAGAERSARTVRGDRRARRSCRRRAPGPPPVAAQVPTRISATDAELDGLAEHGHRARAADAGRLDRQRQARRASPRSSPRARDCGCSCGVGPSRAGRSPAPAPDRRRSGRRRRSVRWVSDRRAWRRRKISARGRYERPSQL